MDKYLFTDGTNGVKEAHSKKELLSLINSSPDPGKTRIWKFSSNEWISYKDLLQKDPSFNRVESRGTGNNVLPVESRGGRSWLKRTVMAAAALTGALLVFNFTSAKWETAAPLKTAAIRPVNVPVMDIDSLVEEIEWLRGKLVDKGTRYNLRLRNNWPEHILLQLDAEKESKGDLSRFFNIKLSIDNTTGFLIDQAQVRLQVWKAGKPERTDTLHFKDIRYEKTLSRQLKGIYRGDSLSVSFDVIRAKAFNFCYSATVKNNSGNYNDRWFCRDGKPAE